MITRTNTFVKSIGQLSLGTIVSNSLVLMFTPLLSSLYSPSSFGTFAFYSSILAIINIFSTLRYHFALPLSDDEEEITLLRSISFTLLVGFTFLTLVISVLFYIQTSNPVYGIVAVGVFVMGSASIENYTLIKDKAFSQIAKSKIGQSVTMITFQILLSFLSQIGLIIGHVLGQIAAFIIQRRGHRHKVHKILAKSRTLPTLKKYKKFPLYYLPDGVLNKLGVHLPIFVLTSSYGSAEAGLFAMADRLLQVPISLLGGAIGQVYYSRGSDLGEGKSANALTGNVTLFLLVISLPLAFGIYKYIPFLLQQFLESKWNDIGIYAQALLPWILMVFITSPVSSYFIVQDEQEVLLKFQMFLLTFRVISFSLILAYDLEFVLHIYGLTCGLVWLVLLCYILHRSKAYKLNFIFKVVSILVFSCLLFYISSISSLAFGLMLNLIVISTFFILIFLYRERFFST